VDPAPSPDVLHRVEDALGRWTASADSAVLDDGPTAEDLGGLALVTAGAAALAGSPLFLFLVDAAGHADAGSDAASVGIIDDAVVWGFAHHPRPSSYASAIARLLRYPTLAARTSRSLEAALLARTKAVQRPDCTPREAATAISALEALVHLTTTERIRPYRLMAFCDDLADTIDTLPDEAVRRLPRLVGALHDHHPDQVLTDLLDRLADVTLAQADAVFELALADLRRALDADSQSRVHDGLLAARRSLAKATELDNERPDAQAYASALDAVFALMHQDADAARTAADHLDAAVSRYWAWLDGYYAPPWAQPRHAAERAWHRLALTLVPATGYLDEEYWFHCDEALVALLAAYEESRAFTGTPHQGVDGIVRPLVEAAFINNAYRLTLLDHALAREPRFRADPVARELADAVHLACAEIRVSDKPLGGDVLGKDLGRIPAALEAFGLTDAIRLLKQADPDLIARIEEKFYDRGILRAAIRNPKMDNLLDDLTAELKRSPDWEIAGKEFSILMEDTVEYLRVCNNVGRKMAGGRTFLFKGRGGTAKEKDLQLNFMDWLERPFAGHVRGELEDVAAGRADIAILLPRFAFYIECKREEGNASREALRKYLGQTRAYTVTDVAFVVLLVLDLTDHSEGFSDLYSSVWIDRVRVGAEETERFVLVARVPGNRTLPSDTRTPRAVGEPEPASGRSSEPAAVEG
jgi:hypothetical protein